jgi:hypothetical protein
MQAFTDLVGTSAVPAHAFDIAELMELTPALDTAQATQEQASEAASTYGPLCDIVSDGPLCALTPALDTAQATHGTSVEASEAAGSAPRQGCSE